MKLRMLYDLVPDYSLSERIKFFLDKFTITDEKIIEFIENKEVKEISFQNEDDKKISFETIKKICKGEYDENFAADKRILHSIEKLNDIFLHIPIEWLLEDYGKYYRAVTFATKKLYNSDESHKYFGRFSIDEIKSDTETRKKNIDSMYFELINDIEKKFISMKLIDCYKLAKYYDIYTNIDEDVWRYLLYNFSCLNEKGKKAFKEYISAFQNPNILNLGKKQLEFIISFINIRDTSEEELRKELKEEFKDKLTDNEKIKLEKELKDKLTKQSEKITIKQYYILKKIYLMLSNVCDENKVNFYRRMKDIVTIDTEDLNNLIIYYSNSTLENQEKILNRIEELVLDTRYSKLSENCMKEARENNYEKNYDDVYDFILYTE